jgi:hypothetical protein
MNSTQFTFWKDEAFFIGFLNNYPDYKTQAFSKQELVENLKDLLIDLESDDVPYIRHVEELELA